MFNGSLKQFSAFNGIILMGPEAVDIFARTAERVEKSGLREKLERIHFTSDLLIPPLKTGSLKDPLEVDREIEGYVGERSRWLDLAEGLVNGNLKAVQDALTMLYKTIDQEMGRNPLKIKAYVPHPGAEVYKEGGIDLSFQPQFIQRSSRASFTPIQEPVIPDGFKGFNFNIVRFTSQLTANSAFQLMFNPN